MHLLKHTALNPHQAIPFYSEKNNIKTKDNFNTANKQ